MEFSSPLVVKLRKEVVKERREEDIPGSALMMAGSAGPHIWAGGRLVEEEEVGDTLCLI